MRVNQGDIILTRYGNFDVEEKVGLFLVLYHECHTDPTSDNFIALKISSKEGFFQVPLSCERITCLDHDSFINCDTQFKFREPDVYRIVGKMTRYYMNKILMQLTNYHNRVQSSLRKYIGEDRLFRDIKDKDKYEFSDLD